MTGKYRNKYRIQSARLPGYDYTRAGLYFITICTQNREHYFGEVVDGKMHLSNVGVLADVLWHEIKNHAKNVELHAFTVMPNHIHGILEIMDKPDDDDDDVEALHATPLHHHVSSPDRHNPPSEKNEQMAEISPKPGSLSRIVGSYKSAVSKHAHRLGYEFAWQSRFYDHIIRNENDYVRISEYIVNNPQKWVDDKFNGDKQ